MYYSVTFFRPSASASRDRGRRRGRRGVDKSRPVSRPRHTCAHSTARGASKMLFADHEARPALIRIGAIVLVSLAFAGCKKEQAGDAASAGTDAATTAAAVDKPAVADKITAMSPEQLREAAGNALRQQRLYAPAGDHAMEYYLALRHNPHSDPAVSTARPEERRVGKE